ncbi:hypothetical protein C1H46_045192 [Malus baccata]|uniref:H(+)-exporting diphosphatase n=1 Tax=Malus baccata TaxID=106549 RepID=A0A540K4X8_MALBA|nr:hypothetical protein C1H46_045192 [Malus baccata]
MAVLLSTLATEIVIPVAAVVGIVFSLVQWFLVSLVKVTPERNAPPSGPNSNKNGYNDYLIEEEEGLNDQNVVVKCAEIQNAISEVLELYTVFVCSEKAGNERKVQKFTAE